MTNLEAIDQLQDLIADRNSFIHLDGDNEVYEQDIQALQIAIAVLSEPDDDSKRKVKKQLRSYNRIRADCDMLRRRIAIKRKDKEQLKAVAIDGMPHSSESSNSLERAEELIDELMKEYIRMLEEREERELHVLKLIEAAPDEDGHSILFLRYIEGRRFEDIPEILHISDRTMWRTYNDAIEKLAVNCSK